MIQTRRPRRWTYYYWDSCICSFLS